MSTTVSILKGPKNLPLVGHLPAFRARPLPFLMKMARLYGDMPHFKLARMPVYFLNHPDLVREVLVTQQNSFIKSRALQRSRILLGEVYGPLDRVVRLDRASARCCEREPTVHTVALHLGVEDDGRAGARALPAWR